MSEESSPAPVSGGDTATPAASPTEAPAVAPRPRPSSDPALNAVRLRAAYLTSLRNVVNAGTDSRRAWVRQVGILMQDAQNRPMAMVTPQAAKIGADQIKDFQAIREKLDELKPPDGLTDCHMLLHTWIDRHVSICQVLVDFGTTGEIARLKSVQRLLAEGRTDLQRFQEEYGRHVASLRKQIELARKRRKAKWPFSAR